VSEPFKLDNLLFRREVLESGVPVLVDFTARWCAPCVGMAAIVGDLAREYAGTIKVALIDTDDNQDIVAQFNVRGLPTLVLFDKGVEVSRCGVETKEGLKRWLDACLGIGIGLGAEAAGRGRVDR
jgi:thioredoxin 1